ncbi:MAG: hypothetical protein J7K21_04230 [Desulfurococcales archaeon]|nr:hypothetical protein [Desulfurococcales archaeon]
MDLGKLFGRKPWIEKVKIDDLEKERLQIDNQILLLTKEIKKLEDQKKRLFREGIGKSDIEKLLIAEKIKDIDADIKMKVREYNKLMKQRRALSNLIRLKQWESRLKERGIWEKIKSIEPEKLMQVLTTVEFEEAQFDKNIDKINEILGAEFTRVEVDESTKEIMKLWEKVEKAELSPETVEEQLAVKISEKEEEEEKEEA